MSIDTEQKTATRIYLEGGSYVRAGESMGQISLMMSDPHMDGWLPVEDPGDGRGKLVRVNRVLWIEEEPDED